MGHGVSSGGGQSSLGYLFGGGEAPKPTKENAPTASSESNVASKESTQKPNAPPQPVEINKQIPAGIHSSTTNNYFRGDGKNTCSFITDRPSTKVHATPGGDSSLGFPPSNFNGCKTAAATYCEA